MKALERTVDLGETSAQAENNNIIITGPEGKIERTFREKLIELSVKDNALTVKALKPTRKAKRIMNAVTAHLRNMVKGVTKKYSYKLKICSGHFPMNVSLSGNGIAVKNFIGEKHDRKKKIKQDVELKLEKDIITVTGIDKEKTGQAAAEIEKLTRIKNKDRRIFMDGIYIIQKP